ncbi:MAG: hypothetical protein J2P54_15880, partial [Bradyrhizobiaceae bacterium]|nr:hypothetical protein [Bradyrhizobiaceae bacterium]
EQAAKLASWIFDCCLDTVPTVENDRAAPIAWHVCARPVDTRLARLLASLRRVTGTAGMEIAHWHGCVTE